MSTTAFRAPGLFPLRWAAPLCLLGIALAGCSTTTTVAKLKDNAPTTLSFRRLGQSTLKPIHRGTTDTEVDIGRFDVEESGSIARQNTALRIQCGQCMDGDFTILSEEGLTAPVEAGVEEISGGDKRHARLKFEYFYTVSDLKYLNPVLETPASNLEYFEETTTPERVWAWSLVPGGLLTIIGIWMMADGSYGPGVALLAPGLTLDVFGILQLVTPVKMRRIGPHGEEIEMEPPPEPEEEEVEEEEPEPEPEEEEEVEEEEPEPEPEVEPEPEPEPEAEPEPEPEPEAEPEPEPEKPRKKKLDWLKKKPEKKRKKGQKLEDFLL
jgi:hypothetical protein